ncbi:MAG: cobalamin transport system substrate-binding protein, partial [Micromonosporaceae bacterium]
MRRRTLGWISALTAVGLALAGCGGTNGSGSATASTAASAAAYPVTAGGVTLDRRPAHIVSLSPTATEMLF